MDSVLPFKTKKNQLNSQPEVWTIGSGKGGVGKSFITSSLALTLTKLDYKVIVVDFDLSGANIHTTFGMQPSHLNIRNYFEGQKTLSELVIPTPYPKLSYIQGIWDSWMPVNYNIDLIKKFFTDLKNLKCDYILIDLGAGALASHLELFKVADEKILVSTPEPTSVEKTYRFIESLLCYSFKEQSSEASFEDLLKTVRQH
ncbi:MAG: P-loop NTPase, partial [Pseudobdellovibrionaceae bacterium]